MDSINTERSYTEYDVTEPTTDFAIGFDNYSGEDKDAIHVTLDGVNLDNLDYTVVRKNAQTIKVTPAIESGVVRLQRETYIDQAFHTFTAGALFSPKSMDENFAQVRRSQQEVNDGFTFLAENTNGVVAAADAATARANAAAELAENTDVSQLQTQLTQSTATLQSNIEDVAGDLSQLSTEVVTNKVYVDSLKYSTRAEFVSAVSTGLVFQIGVLVSAGNVMYKYTGVGNSISDLPKFEPFGTVEFEHFGGFPKRDDPTRAIIKHYRQDANTILDVVRIINPKPDTFTLKTHPDIAPNGDSPRISLRTFAALNNVAAMVNGNAFKNIDGSAGAGNAIIKPDGVLIADGVAYTGWADAGNVYKTHALLCKRDGIFHPTYRYDGGDAASYVAEGTVWGFSWGAWLVLNGVAQTIPTDIASNTKSARTIIGQAANGDYIIICAEGSTGSYGLTPNECGVVAAQHGCERAFMCDGGGSAQLWWDTFYALPSSDNSFSDERTLGTGLAINCPISVYDTGWINQPLASGFTAKDTIGVRVRQTNSKINFEFFVEGTFTTTGTQVLAGTRPLRYMPSNGIGTARGALVGAGGSLGTWYTGNSISIRKSVDTDVTNYFGGHTSWTTKHAPVNTTN